jgi:predicted Zn-ribbon and HTH transcriptional regulator
MKPLICKRCGHEWMPRKPKKPPVCARCKRADWNISKPRDGARGK